ncbi:MAG: hypothetical protein SGJ15_07710 [Bacteroidota bacterium]|nr:hypothetical protein [Bacteroidota bacterium]
MNKIYFLLFILIVSIDVKAQSVMSTTIICFRDANNNGIKDVTENPLSSSIDLFLLDSSSVYAQIHFCGVPLTFSATSSQTHYFLLFRQRFNQYSNFWTLMQPPNPFLYKYISGSINFGSIVYVPIPPDFGNGYFPVTDNLKTLTTIYPSHSCMPDSIGFSIYLGNIDSVCL